MPRGGSLIGMLVGEACQAIGRRKAWEAAGHLNAAQARAEARRLEGIRAYHVPASDVLQEEKWSAQASLLELMRRKDWPGSLLGMTGNAAENGNEADNGLRAPNFDKWALGTRIRLTGKRTIMANYTRYMDQSIAIARQPYATHSVPPTVPSDPVNQLLLPVFAGIRFGEVEAHTQNALLLITLALQAYQKDHGPYPAALSLLTPHYLRNVSDDPFALSGPMHYKRLGNKYLLYSVGPDGIDDGGRAIFNATLPAPANPGDIDRRRFVEQVSLGDIVAGVNIL
jgi:type II secretory pathway pseudopilin PulG